MQDLFERMGDLSSDKVTEISLSYLEIYNETIRDWLTDGVTPKGGLMSREDSNQAVSVLGLGHPARWLKRLVTAVDGIGDKDVKSLDSALLVGEKRNEVV